MGSDSIDVVGLGNALLDMQVRVPDEFLKDHQILKASMQLVDIDFQKTLLSSLLEKKLPLEISSGGCVANSLAGISNFGGRAKLVAKLGSDSNAEAYQKDLKKIGVSFSTAPHDSLSTGTCLAFITPDAERSMLTHLGAAQALSPDDILPEDHEKAKITYLEGYLWDSPSAKAACWKAAEIAKRAGKKVALTLSDSHCVVRHFNDFWDFTEKFVDILFCNESEVKAFSKSHGVEESFLKIKNLCEFIFVSVGSHGALLSSDFGNSTESIGTWDVPLIDKLGAGDLFAGGVLFGLSNNNSLRESGYLGCFAATKVIQQMSARLNESLQKQLNEALHGPQENSTKALELKIRA